VLLLFGSEVLSIADKIKNAVNASVKKSRSIGRLQSAERMDSGRIVIKRALNRACQDE
jgi:hypothetical protein